jgi:hypothetical protein
MDAWSVLAVLVLGGIAAWTVRMPVLRGKLLPSLRPFVAAFAKPSDYFAPLQKSNLDLSREGSRTTMKVRHRYAGRHTVEISVSKPVPNGVVSYGAGFELLLEFLIDGRTTVSRNLQSVSPWWSYSENGFTLAMYSVPDDAPVGKEIELALTVKKADPDFEPRYGAITLFTRKASEK